MDFGSSSKCFYKNIYFQSIKSYEQVRFELNIIISQIFVDLLIASDCI